MVCHLLHLFRRRSGVQIPAWKRILIVNEKQFDIQVWIEIWLVFHSLSPGAIFTKQLMQTLKLYLTFSKNQHEVLSLLWNWPWIPEFYWTKKSNYIVIHILFLIQRLFSFQILGMGWRGWWLLCKICSSEFATTQTWFNYWTL